MYKFQTSRGPDNRGTEGDEGEGIWEAVSPSPADYRDLGEHHKLLVHTENEFWSILELEKHT